MSVKLSSIQKVLEDFAPLNAAESWDNPGLLLGRTEKEVSTVFIALDATEEVLEKAVNVHADLLLTHHPVIFRKISSITDGSGQGRKYLNFLIEDISVYSMHTNFDSCPGGMGKIVCETLGLEFLGPMERGQYQEANSFVKERREQIEQNDALAVYGLGFLAELDQPVSCAEFARLVKESFDLPFVSYYDAGRSIRRIACCPGSGRGQFDLVKTLGIDVFLTGDMGHHEGLDYTEEGISLVDAGHYGLEHVFIREMAEFMREKFPDLSIVEDEIDFICQIV